MENNHWKGSVEECINFIKEDINEIKSKLICISERLNSIDKSLIEQVKELDKKIAILDIDFKNKSGIWGVVGGALVLLINYLINWIFKK